MTNAPDFINNAIQRERAEIVREERKLRRGDRDASTYHAQAMAGLDEPGGRWAQSRYVSGSEPSTRYPAASSPWSSSADVGVEPPTGEDINFVAPVGEAHEIEASIAEQETGAPETGAITQSRVPNRKSPGSSSEVAGAPPTLDATEQAHSYAEQYRAGSAHELHSVASSHSTKLAASSNPPDDGLNDVPRRSDGWPMSSHAIKPSTKRRKL
jgi:hypothetical protein